MTKFKQKKKQLRGIKVVVKYALKSSTKLLIINYLCSLIKLILYYKFFFFLK